MKVFIVVDLVTGDPQNVHVASSLEKATAWAAERHDSGDWVVDEFEVDEATSISTQSAPGANQGTNVTSKDKLPDEVSQKVSDELDRLLPRKESQTVFSKDDEIAHLKRELDKADKRYYALLDEKTPTAAAKTEEEIEFGYAHPTCTEEQECRCYSIGFSECWDSTRAEREAGAAALKAAPAVITGGSGKFPERRTCPACDLGGDLRHGPGCEKAPAVNAKAEQAEIFRQTIKHWAEDLRQYTSGSAFTVYKEILDVLGADTTRPVPSGGNDGKI